VRFLFASARSVAAEAAAGRFRHDLLHRIQVVLVDVPPLRERPEGLPELVRAFLAEGGADPLDVAEDAWERLREHAWPGNVGELKNVLSRLRLESPGRLGAPEVARVLGQSGGGLFPGNTLAGSPLKDLQDRLERDYLL
jgi:transcriptional regulator of aroF, aroG, tyrA and aromatic amino acid transport